MFARTERLLLRPGWIEDAPAVAAALADEEVVEKLARVPWPYTIADAEAYLAREEDARLPSLVVLARGDGAPRLIGCVGLHEDDAGGIELGYWYARAAWGRGYATEAGRALLGMARALGLRRLVSGHFVDNPASGNVLRKLGFRATGRTAPRHCRARGVEVETVLFERRLDKASEALAA